MIGRQAKTEAAVVKALTFSGTQSSSFDLPLDFPIERGTAAHALIWAKSFPGLERFVRRFPTALFYRDLPKIFENLLQTDGIAMPPWWVRGRTTLAFAVPDIFPEFKLRKRRGVSGSWYRFSTGVRGSEPFDSIFQATGLVPIAADNQAMALLIDTRHPSDQTIYAVDSEEVNASNVREEMTPAFEGYVDLLDSVCALLLSVQSGPDGLIENRFEAVTLEEGD